VTVSGRVPVYLYIFSETELTLTGQSIMRESAEICGAPCDDDDLEGVFIVTTGFFRGQLRGSYTGDSKNITIPEVVNDPDAEEDITVTSIYQDVFREKSLEGVTFNVGSEFRRIHARAFYKNTLSTLVLPDALLRIDLWAFRDNNLSSLVLPDSLLRIDQRAFQGNALSVITIPAEVHTIEQYAFAENPIIKVTIGDKVTTIGDQAFGANKPDDLRSLYESQGAGTYNFVDGNWVKE
jgi:hypothetical protein